MKTTQFHVHFHFFDASYDQQKTLHNFYDKWLCKANIHCIHWIPAMKHTAKKKKPVNNTSESLSRTNEMLSLN